MYFTDQLSLSSRYEVTHLRQMEVYGNYLNNYNPAQNGKDYLIKGRLRKAYGLENIRQINHPNPPCAKTQTTLKIKIMTLTTSKTHVLLSLEERSAIAEVEATIDILKLVTRLTRMRFAAIAKFTDNHWVTCAVYDPLNLGIEEGLEYELETTICSEFCINPEALYIPQISKVPRYSTRAIVKTFDLESYAGVPILLPDGSLFGALCVLDSDSISFEDPDLRQTLSIFAKLVGCIFFANSSAR